MTSIDVVANIEKADKAGGVNAAYDQFKVEVDSINRNFTPGEREKQMANLTSELNQAGLLPELSLKWAQDHRFEITQDGQFSRTDLSRFKKGNDAISQAMAGALIEQYDDLRTKHGDFGMFPHGFDLTKSWFGYEAISKNDLNNAVNDLQKAHDDKVKDYNTGKSAGELARRFDTEGGGTELFNKLAKCDGRADGISLSDISRTLQADKLMGGVLSDSERKIVQTLQADWNKPYVQKLIGKDGQISAETLQANKDVLAQAEAAEASQEPTQNPEGAVAGIAGGVVAAAAGVLDQLQQKQVEIQPGDGFDRIARRELMSQGLHPTAAQVIEYSKKIAEHNNMNRDTTVLLASDKLNLPKFEQ